MLFPSVSFSISIYGARYTGKTSLCRQFQRQTLSDPLESDLNTIDDCRLIIKDYKCAINVVDASFNEQDAALSYLPITLGDAAILVYSTTDIKSFEMVSIFKEAIDKLDIFQQIPIVLVGTSTVKSVNERTIPTEDGIALATLWGCPFFEIIIDNTTYPADAIFTAIAENLLDRPQSAIKAKYDCSKPVVVGTVTGARLNCQALKHSNQPINTIFNIWSFCYNVKRIINTFI
ncbi:hypothetical protein BDF19DRAFT_430731 [Syncephalis fuscata]|nr:hypothetical protein BDF19DRAFT_430731 [Syncephalis fuscata]